MKIGSFEEVRVWEAAAQPTKPTNRGFVFANIHFTSLPSLKNRPDAVNLVTVPSLDTDV